MDRPCGKADCDTVIRDIGSHDGIGPHIDAIPYANVANQLGAGIKDDVIADAWVVTGLVIAPARAANCDLLVYRAVAADTGTGADHDPRPDAEVSGRDRSGRRIERNSQNRDAGGNRPSFAGGEGAGDRNVAPDGSAPPRDGARHGRGASIVLAGRDRPGPAKGVECQCLKRRDIVRRIAPGLLTCRHAAPPCRPAAYVRRRHIAAKPVHAGCKRRSRCRSATIGSRGPSQDVATANITIFQLGNIMLTCMF